MVDIMAMVFGRESELSLLASLKLEFREGIIAIRDDKVNEDEVSRVEIWKGRVNHVCNERITARNTSCSLNMLYFVARKIEI